MHLFSSVNLWVFFAGTALVSVIFYEAGFQFGKFRYRHASATKNANFGTMIGSTFGLLAFILAFTFGIAASHFDARKNAVLEDANAIRSAYAKADLLSEPYRGRVRDLLREYVALRLRISQITTAAELRAFTDRAEEIQGLLWTEAMANEAKAPGGGASWLFVDKLDEMITKHFNRIAIATRPRIPATIWLVLYLIALLSMSAAGYQSGVTGGRGSFVFLISCIAFSLILVLIADLDRPKQGLFKISQQSLENLEKKIAADAAGEGAAL